jgi:serine/threonine protein kinase
VAEGLNFLHTTHTIHGDLKGVGRLPISSRTALLTLGQPNILTNSDGHACLADFGLASIAHGNNSIATDVHGFTARWTAPEILKGAQNITREADVFSFGMVVMEVSSRVSPCSFIGDERRENFADILVLLQAFTGKPPLSELNNLTAALNIMAGERPVHPFGTEELGFVDPVWNMTVDCWQHDPASRPTMAAVVEFLREWSALSLHGTNTTHTVSHSYTEHTADPSLSKLSPWKSTRNADDASTYGLISPTLADGNISPTRSMGTSQNSGHSFTSTQEQPQSQTFNVLPPGLSHSSRTSLGGSLSDESLGHSISGDHSSLGPFFSFFPRFANNTSSGYCQAVPAYTTG